MVAVVVIEESIKRDRFFYLNVVELWIVDVWTVEVWIVDSTISGTGLRLCRGCMHGLGMIPIRKVKHQRL
jgi:hypothetical protein